MSIPARPPRVKRAQPTLADLGEDRLIGELIRHLPLGPEVRVGPGDDCAVIGGARDRVWHLLKTDVIVEGVHFLDSDDPRRVGWKALGRAISDVAAMGGLPGQAVITIAATPDLPLEYLKALYEGLTKAARRFGVSIVGGETSRSPGPLFVNVALTGMVERKQCVLRSGGRPGDALYVTGKLGGSRAGKHLDFVPRLGESRWLTTHFRPHAMMDLSDGLATDLPRLARASGCGFALERDRVPCTRGVTLDEALNDGEDFELLCAIPIRSADKLENAWRDAFPKLALTRIGALTDTPESSSATSHGHDHFA
jgi:thiamine-monophosphate kinase